MNPEVGLPFPATPSREYQNGQLVSAIYPLDVYVCMYVCIWLVGWPTDVAHGHELQVQLLVFAPQRSLRNQEGAVHPIHEAIDGVLCIHTYIRILNSRQDIK